MGIGGYDSIIIGGKGYTLVICCFSIANSSMYVCSFLYFLIFLNPKKPVATAMIEKTVLKRYMIQP